MKKLTIIFALFIALSLVYPALIAQADILWEPQDDFYERNRSDMRYEGRAYYAFGDGDYITLVTEPGSRREVIRYNNGEIIHIQFTYNHNGEIWGIGNNPGWVPMAQLLLVYDHISFAREHGTEFYAFSGSIDGLLDAENIVFWTWPGSGQIVFEHEPLSDNRELEETWLSPIDAYRDSEGREWGLIGYFYASRNMWVCISDPSNTAIPAFFAAPEPDFSQPGGTPGSGGSQDRTPGRTPGRQNGDSFGDGILILGGNILLLLIIILVGVVVVVTAVLILVFWKKKA